MQIKKRLFLFGLAASTPLLALSNSVFAAESCVSGEFKSVISGNCLSSYDQWIAEVWGWTMGIVVTLATLVLSAAAVVYMSSGGNPDRVKLAKKMLYGVLSGVALIILARVLLVNFIGIDNKSYEGRVKSSFPGSSVATPTITNIARTENTNADGTGGGTSGGGGSGGGGSNLGGD